MTSRSPVKAVAVAVAASKEMETAWKDIQGQRQPPPNATNSLKQNKAIERGYLGGVKSRRRHSRHFGRHGDPSFLLSGAAEVASGFDVASSASAGSVRRVQQLLLLQELKKEWEHLK
jgi:hypothetical protein